MDAYVHQRHFTLDEARKELTTVHALAARIVELKASLDRKGWDIRRHQYFGGMGPNGDGQFPSEMETLVDIVRGLETRGVLVKDLDEGLVDFPHLRNNGEEVYLCWMVGEDDIGYWHELHEGFAGRKTITDL